jgi:superfamily I DNA/RNA helicase
MNYFTKQVELNNVQQAIIDGEPNIIVKGLAGTGKTMTVVHLAQKLSKNNTVGIVIFTLSLKKFLIECINSDNASVITSKRLLKTFDYIIVDEVQDFTLADIIQMQSYSKYGVYFFGDDHQQLNWRGEKNATIEEIQSITNFPVVELIDNVRFSKPIENFIKKYVFHKNPFDVVINDAKELVYSQIDTALIIARLLKVLDGSTAIICNRNDQVEKYSLLLQENGHKNIGYKVGRDEQLNLDCDDAINVLTFHSAKGLEFQNVIVIGGRKEPEYFYVGASRASKNIIVLISDFDGETAPFAFFVGDPVKYWQVKLCDMR